MPATTTKRLSYHVADQYLEAFSETNDTKMYMFVGRTSPYANDSSASTPTNDIQSNDYDIYKQMLAAKKISTTDVTLAIKRYNWSNNQFYTQYDNNTTDFYDKRFYVYTTDRNVYKCLFNNKNANSTVMPTGTSTGITQTADGYQWKYMFTISAADNGKFVSTNYLPVDVLSANDGSAQFAAQAAAVNGAIDIINVTGTGRGYLTDNGAFQSIGNSTTVTLATTASSNDSVYIGSTLYLTSGLGAGLIRTITGYVGASKVATVNTAFTTTPNTSTQYLVSPRVIITGDGQGALAYSNVINSNGAVNYVTMISSGSNYSNTTVTISANTSFGTGATADAVIPPRGGHGSNAREELGGSFVMTATSFEGTEANTVPVENNIRTFGLIRDPLLRNGNVANTINFDMTTRLTLSGATGDFTSDEKITGGTSGATANVVSFANTNSANSAGVLRVINITGRFQNNEVITGSTSSRTATISPLANSDLTFYKGDVLYVENRTPITRSTDQIENFKIILGF